MEGKETFITPSAINAILTSGQNVSIGDDFVVSRQRNPNSIPAFGHPLRINCYMAVFCSSGSISCMLNMNEYTLSSGMLMVITPGNIVRITSPDLEQALSNASFTFIAVSVDYISNASLDFNSLFSEALALLQNPCIKITDSELLLLSDYINLVYKITGTTAKYVRESVSEIMSSVFYQFASYVDDYLRDENIRAAALPDNTRQRRMFEAFMKLVKDNHNTERMVGFYADKLCVTPKYLSKVVREVSGRSAPDWIDGFVIMSAKSMLKYSDMTVKEIAIELNFPNQSFFSKFFKSQTGLTPNEYRSE
ncbi:MAG: AraC family transcriptional regulator [Salinivirgaceae bacterium]|nr:AraC family transcriptional regulator [Salinivirgaceae bacterium]